MTIPPAVKSAWDKFLGFWFNPADPTAMGFIRIVTGCLVLYVHLVYSFDLTAFFGRDAWYDLETANRTRWEEPTRDPTADWEHKELTRSAAFPDSDGARKAVFDWVRALPSDKAELARKLRLIDESGILNGTSLPRYPGVHPYMPVGLSWFGVTYAHDELSPNPDVRANTLKVLTGDLPTDKNDKPPPPAFDWLSVGYLMNTDGSWGGPLTKMSDADLQKLAKQLRDWAAARPANDPKGIPLLELADAVAARNMAGLATGLPDQSAAWTALKGVANDMDRIATQRRAGGASGESGEALTNDIRGFANRLKNYDRIPPENRMFRGLKHIARELKQFGTRIEREYPQEGAAMSATAALFEPLPDHPRVSALLTLALKAFAVDLDAFASTLPADVRDKKVVVTYLQNLGNVLRDNLLEFLRDSADPVPAFERERRIRYLERWGYEERYLQRAGTPIFSVWFHITEPGEMIAVHVLVLVVVLMFTLGLFTRVTSVLTWLAAVSYLHRDPQVLFGQDTMMNILLLYLMVANCGAALSLDRVIARYRATRASIARCGGIDGTCAAFLAAPPPSVACGFAQRLLQVHFCFIYMASGLAKLKGATWWSNDAMWLTLVNPEFTMIHFDWYENLVRAMFANRPFYSTVAAVGVAFTLFMEIGLPFLVWTRLRPYMVIGGFLLHFGIGVFMGLLVFSLFMMTLLLSYLPGVTFREGLFGNGNGDGKPPPAKKPVPVKPTDPKSVHAAAWAVAWDTKGLVEVVKG